MKLRKQNKRTRGPRRRGGGATGGRGIYWAALGWRSVVRLGDSCNTRGWRNGVKRARCSATLLSVRAVRQARSGRSGEGAGFRGIGTKSVERVAFQNEKLWLHSVVAAEALGSQFSAGAGQGSLSYYKTTRWLPGYEVGLRSKSQVKL